MMHSCGDLATHLRRIPDERGYDSFGRAPPAARFLGYLGQVEGREVVREAVVDLTSRVEPGFGGSVSF